MAKLQVTGDMPLLGRCFPCARNLLEWQSEDWRWLPLIYHYIFFVSLCMAYIDPQTQKKQVTNEKESAGHCEWMSQFMPAEESIDRMGKGQGMLPWRWAVILQNDDKLALFPPLNNHWRYTWRGLRACINLRESSYYQSLSKTSQQTCHSKWIWIFPSNAGYLGIPRTCWPMRGP